jgi:hypothetical protein
MPASETERLAEAVADFYADPLGFVLFAFPWGEPGTALEHEDGPDAWHRTFLDDLGAEVRRRAFNGRDPVEPVRMAVASGHGIGKSALSAWLVLWLMSTRPNCKGTVTASTAPQLETKTWPELAKWHKLCATRDWFDLTMGRGSMKIVARSNPEGWRATAQTSKEENSESFAGQHAADSSSWYLFDEASAVPDKIAEVAEGGLTDGEPFFFLFGNPTRNSGHFHRVFHRLRHRWRTYHVDARTAKKPNKALHAQWIEDHGLDSDFVKVRVLGQFPNQSAEQLIATHLVDEARRREGQQDDTQRLIFGVDVARSGDDWCVIAKRRGRDAKSWPWRRFKAPQGDMMNVVGIVTEEYERHRAMGDEPVVFLDETGMGGPAGDRLRQLGVDVIGVNFGQQQGLRRRDAANKRAEMWLEMRDWLPGGAVPDDQRLADDLTGPEYAFNRDNKVLLESKDDMKARGLASPDDGDALALTFAMPVAPKSWGVGRAGQATARRDYDPLG